MMATMGIQTRLVDVDAMGGGVVRISVPYRDTAGLHKLVLMFNSIEAKAFALLISESAKKD